MFKKFYVFICSLIYAYYSGYGNFKNIETVHMSLDSQSDIKRLIETTNTVIKIEHLQNDTNFFRESRVHDKFNIYLKGIIEEYFLNCEIDFNTYTFLNSWLEKRKNILMLLFGKFPKASQLKISENNHKILYDRLMGEVCQYLYNYKIKKGEYQNYSAARSLATKICADILGVGRIIPQTQYISLKIDESIVKFGVLVKHTGGISVSDFFNDKFVIVPQLQRDLSCLRLLDEICYQNDHYPNNYHIVLEKLVGGVGICAFDNDNQKSFFPTEKINLKPTINGALLVDGDKINLPFISVDMYDKIYNLSFKDVNLPLSGILSSRQIKMCFKRILKIKKLILKNVKSGRVKLLKDNEWTYETMKIELNGDFGNTYLCQLYDYAFRVTGEYPKI